jgi:hypothetical protein
MRASDYSKLLENAHKLPLSATLPNVLRLAESTGEGELATWIRLELLGYSASNPVMTEQTEIPEYRTVGGSWFDAYGQCLVLEPSLGFINEIRLQPGVTELESFVGPTGTIAIQIPGRSDIIRQHLGVEVTTFRFSPKAIPQVLATSRPKC